MHLVADGLEISILQSPELNTLDRPIRANRFADSRTEPGFFFGHLRVPKSEGYLNRSVPGVKKGWIEGGWRGEKRGENDGKRVGGKGPESALEKLWFEYPCDLGTL